MRYIKHISGEMTDGVQKCVVCGHILSDYRGTMVPAGTPPLRGWNPGPVYVNDNDASPSGLKITSSTTILGPGEMAVDCTPSINQLAKTHQTFYP